jgi:hypothetical protein
VPGLYRWGCERDEREASRGDALAAHLLDTTGRGRRLAGGLGGELLARGLATGRLAGGLRLGVSTVMRKACADDGPAWCEPWMEVEAVEVRWAKVVGESVRGNSRSARSLVPPWLMLSPGTTRAWRSKL